MDEIILSKEQSQQIAQEVYGDIKSYCNDNAGEYFQWFFNKCRKRLGLPPSKKRIKLTLNFWESNFLLYEGDDLDFTLVEVKREN